MKYSDVNYKDIFEAIVSLTKHTDLISVRKSFIEIFKYFKSVRSASIYKNCKNSNTEESIEYNITDLYFIDSIEYNRAQKKLKEHEGLNKCLKTNKKCKLELPLDSLQQDIYPIQGIDKISQILVIDYKKHFPEEEFFIECLVKIFSNYHFLLLNTDHDALTKLLNRQAFDSTINKLLRGRTRKDRSEDRQKKDICLAIIDIDHFKNVNDGFGHLFGDEVLIHFSRILNDSLRDNDLLFRYGGEEFAVILKDIGLADSSAIILERLRKRVESYDFPQVGRVTISIGFVIIKQGEAPFIAIDKADKALYYAKRNGRNRVCSYEQLIKEGKLDAADYKEYDIELY